MVQLLMVELRSAVPVCDFLSKPMRHLSLKPGIYRVRQIKNPTGLGVDWYVLADQPNIGAAIPVWQDEIVSNANGKFYRIQKLVKKSQIS